MSGIRTARRFAFLAVLAALSVAAACSGDSRVQVTGIDGGGVALGAISRFGSVFVNGVEYSTTRAQISVNGQMSTEAQLRVGQVVTVSGTIAASGLTGAAASITFDDDVIGPIAAIDLAGSSFVVLGQTVHTDATTTFDSGSIQPAELASLAVGDVVEVSGFQDAAGAILASRIERFAGGEVEVSGSVANLDASAKQFNLNALVVDYTAAQLPNGAPSNGACVEAEGDSASLIGGVLHATRVLVKSCRIAVANGDKGEIEGVVTMLRSPSDFDVGSQPVLTNASTQYDGGTSVNLAPNVKVEIEGTFNAGGTLVASKVKFEQASELRAEGTIDALMASTSTLTIFGIPVTTNAVTRFEDNSSPRASPFSFASLRVGDYVEVRGVPGQQANSVAATVLVRKDIDSERELRGFAANLAPPTLSILGVNVVTNGATAFEDVSGASLSAAEFFAQATGRVVDAEGSWDGMNFLASKLELKGP